jgi:3-oxoacyl-[acyl-carrier-protein] synthase-3
MQILEISNLVVEGVCSCLPVRQEDNLGRCIAIYGDSAKASSVVKATGIKRRRIVETGTTSLDLCCAAAKRLLADVSCLPDEIGALVSVSFTPARQMPCNACAAQARLGVPTGIMAFDINLACSGYAYGLYMAGLLARQTGRKVLLLDGDTQTTFTDPKDVATVPVLADAGTATLVAPCAEGGDPWKFAFLSDGAKGDVLTLPHGGSITMDGFGIFKFVAIDVSKFIKQFLVETQVEVDAFIPHQANVYMIEQLTKMLKIDRKKLWVSGDELGNSCSATVPTTMAYVGRTLPATTRRILISGFGGGLSASVGWLTVGAACHFLCFDYEG